MHRNTDPRWDSCLQIISNNVSTETFNAWFRPLAFESFDETTRMLVLQVPSSYYREYLEENYIQLLGNVLIRVFGKGVRLGYREVVTSNGGVQTVQSDPAADIGSHTPKEPANVSPDKLDAVLDLDPQLNPRLTFNNYIEGDSNKLPRSIGLSIAEHPGTTQFNPMFIFGPSGCGKTHLINAIGVRTKELYPQKRVLYVSARLFQVQYTDSVRHNTTNDFISFYQTIDVLIVDDIQEWINAEKTLNTFFHIFNHLFRNGKRIILASDRPPKDLAGMPDRLITRFACGLIAELEKPNTQLCADILHYKIKRDGLQIPEDVIQYIAHTASGSVRDLQGVVNSLLAYSIVYNSNIDMRLAERVIKRAVKMDDRPLTIDEIIDTVCRHYNVRSQDVASRSRRREYVQARQVSMYLAQKYTKMPASRIGRLVGGRDHSTVIHSCNQVEAKMRVDKKFSDDLQAIEHSFRLKNA